MRIYNLMRRAAADFDQVLVAFTEESLPVPRELREICAEIVTVRRAGSHALPSRGRPDTVEEFDTPAFHAALRQTIAKWKPGIVQLEFTQMAQYAPDCAPARTILVEHDITYDLYAQMLATGNDDWEIRRQHELWTSFETAAWRQVDRVVTMSEKDRALVAGRSGDSQRRRSGALPAVIPSAGAAEAAVHRILCASAQRDGSGVLPARRVSAARERHAARDRGPAAPALLGSPACRSRSGGFRLGCAPRLPARDAGDRAAGGFGRHQHQDPGSHGDGQGDRFHRSRDSWPGVGAGSRRGGDRLGGSHGGGHHASVGRSCGARRDRSACPPDRRASYGWDAIAREQKKLYESSVYSFRAKIA